MYATPREDWDPSIFFVKSLGKAGGSDFFFSVGITHGFLGIEMYQTPVQNFDMYNIHLTVALIF